jgi:hypothetical protein
MNSIDNPFVNFRYQNPVPYIFNKSHTSVIENIIFIFKLIGVESGNILPVIIHFHSVNYPWICLKPYIEQHGLFYMDLNEIYSYLTN